MQVSVIIPTINEQENIERAVSSAWDAGASEVIVADGGSTDGTLEIATALRCHLVHAPTGRAHQQNAGADQASGSVLFFQHADTWLVPQGISQIRAAVELGARHGAFVQRIEAKGWRFRWLERGNAWRARRGRAYGDQGLFVQRELFERLGGFPDEPIMEDLLLSRQLRRQGRPAILAGPLYVSPRRWLRHGVIRQTLRNWSLLALHRAGVPPRTLHQWYVRHDLPAESPATH